MGGTGLPGSASAATLPSNSLSRQPQNLASGRHRRDPALANDGSTTPKDNPARNAKRPTSLDKIAKYVHQLADGDDKAAAGHMIASSYVAELRHADRQQARWQKIFYEYRGFVIAASAVITILTGLNLQGNTSFVIRVTTVILSGMITVASRAPRIAPGQQPVAALPDPACQARSHHLADSRTRSGTPGSFRTRHHRTAIPRCNAGFRTPLRFPSRYHKRGR